MPGRQDFVELAAGPDDAGRRLDKVLRSLLGEAPLSAVYSSLRHRRILVNGKPAEASLRLAPGDRISLDPALLPARAGPGLPPAAAGGPSLSGLIVLETEDLLFLNKPRGMLVHGKDSLEELVRAYLGERSRGSLSFKPGPLHRLDRNTSGLVAFPRSAAGARAFAELLRSRRIEKRYLALLEGSLGSPAVWEDLLERDGERGISSAGSSGRPARSRALPLAEAGGLSLALVELGTGLTHQIRAQAAARGLALAGDAKYGGRPLPGGYLLHALALRFPEPPFPDLPREVSAPLPPRARARLEAIFGAEATGRALEAALAP